MTLRPLLAFALLARPLTLSAQPVPGSAAAAAPAQRTLEPEAPEAANQRYAIGVDLYRQGQYAAAAREFRVAQKLWPRSPKLAYNLGRSLERAGDLTAALEQYQLYLDLSPTATDRATVLQVMAALREDLTRKPGRLSVASRPVGAAVHLDGAEVPAGAAPLEAEVPAGRHVVRVALDGYRDESRTIDVAPGGTVALAVDLVPDPKSASLEVEPAPPAWQRPAAWGTGAGAVVALGVGTYFLVQASGTADESDGLGPGDEARRSRLQDDLDGQTTGMWVGFAAGALLAGASAALFLWSPDAATSESGGSPR